MINFKNLSPKIAKINDEHSSNDIMELLLTTGKTVIFTEKESGVQFLKQAGFEQNKKKLKHRYFYKIIEQHILIVQLNKIWIDEKYFLPLNSRNLDFCKTGFNGDFFEILGKEYERVEENLNKTFYESFRNRKSLSYPTAEYLIKMPNGQVYRIYQTSRTGNFTIFPWFCESNLPFIFDNINFNKNGNLTGGMFHRKKQDDEPYFFDNHPEIFDRSEYELTLDNFYHYWDNFTQKQLKEFSKLLKNNQI